MRETLEICLTVGQDQHDLLIAELLEIAFEGFEQGDETLKAFIPSDVWTAETGRALTSVLRSAGIDDVWVEKRIPDQNWNRTWEQTIQPIRVGQFLIRPTWALPDEQETQAIQLIVDPKMSFGTGYHESTRLVLRQLPDLIQGGDRVLDAGAGTGILSIAALKLGADQATGFDFDPWSVENAPENAVLNDVEDRAEFLLGSMEVVHDEDFSVVLANINRNALLSLMPDFRRVLVKGGILVMAGLLLSDRQTMLTALAANGFQAGREVSEGQWWSVSAVAVGHSE